MRTILVLVALVILTACTREAEAPRPVRSAATAAPAAPPPVLRAEAVESPAGQGSAQPGLSVDGRGRALLSWIEPLPSGSVYVGGAFWTLNGTAAPGIVRLGASGVIDATFDPGYGFDDFVLTMLRASDGSGDLYVAGEFTSYDGAGAPRIVRLDASGAPVKTGAQIEIGGNERYVSVCRRHYKESQNAWLL